MVELQVQFAHKFQVNVLIRFLRMKCNDNSSGYSEPFEIS